MFIDFLYTSCILNSRQGPFSPSITSCLGPVCPPRSMNTWPFKRTSKLVLLKSITFGNLELQRETKRPFHPLPESKMFLLWKHISNCNHRRKEVWAIMLWIWSAEAAHWDAVFLRSYNFGRNHLGNFPLPLIYSAYGDLVSHAQNASHLYSHFSFFPTLVTLIISFDRHSL